MDGQTRSGGRSIEQRLAEKAPLLLVFFSVIVATILTLKLTWGLPVTGLLDSVAWLFMWGFYFVFVCVATFAVYGLIYVIYRLDVRAHSRAGIDLRKKPSERLIEWLKSKGS